MRPTDALSPPPQSQQSSLDDLSGEPLADSGFEQEKPPPERRKSSR